TPYAQAVRDAAVRVGVPLRFVALNTKTDEAEYRRAFAAIREQGVDALAIPAGADIFIHRRLIVELVEELRLPAVYPFRDFAYIGGLMAYAVDIEEMFRHAARQVGQILKGANPGEIPIFRATKYQLLINLKAAKALGLTIPPSVLVRADEVIE